MRRRLPRLILIALLAIVVAGVATVVWARHELRGSLPRLSGQAQLHGLSGPVLVERDALGVPWVRGRSREDVARATGFLHAQERFFQMDLSRRRAAGELAALFGERALPLDREIRIHRFRAEAQRAVALLPAADRVTLDAYAAGVNAGLAQLQAAPFEYLVIGETPQPWTPEDSFLVVLSMFVTLQDTDGAYESAVATMHEVLPPAVAAFLNPPGTEWDAPILGGPLPMPPIPGPEIYDLRSRRRGKRPIELPPPRSTTTRHPAASHEPRDAVLAALAAGGGDEAVGSNNWAVAGRLTTDGRPLLANDMHLAIRVPNTWYRAAFEWPDASEGGGTHQVIGLTLPGVPSMVVGSNTHVAWGFTNTYADWSDIVLLEIDPADANRYRTPDGWKRVERHDEIIDVAGGDSVRHQVEWTVWGPLLDPDARGRRRAYRWVAHDADRLASALIPIEGAHTVTEAFDRANGRGTPGQNIVAVDSAGSIGWSVFGALPRRVGLDGARPMSWADGSRGWSGWLEPHEYPRVMDPPDGRIWTANARVVDGQMLAALGDGSYEVGSRASVIRRRLTERERFGAEDMLAIQLDTSADFLTRWRDLIVRTLTSSPALGETRRAEAREILTRAWSGQAAADSAGYRITRLFRDEVSRQVITFVLSECYEADPSFDYLTVRRREGPIWALITQQPLHLLDPAYRSWDELLLASLDTVLTTMMAGRSGSLRDRVWSEHNVAGFQHPLSGSLPLAGRWLDMPVQPLPGDLFTPRMHWGVNGASQRMVVSPGNEAAAIMQTPTGQSGHPLSPFYGATHDAWVKGTPTPFLPGATAYKLTLTP
jgi:penicillin amidase